MQIRADANSRNQLIINTNTIFLCRPCRGLCRFYADHMQTHTDHSETHADDIQIHWDYMKTVIGTKIISKNFCLPGAGSNCFKVTKMWWLAEEMISTF